MKWKIRVSDREFLGWFDLSRPSMRQAAELLAQGDEHAAALLAARNAPEGPVCGAIAGSDLEETRKRVLRMFPRAIDLELDTAKLLLMAEIPTPAELGFVVENRIGLRARCARSRGNDVLICAFIYHLTGDAVWARRAVDMGLAAAHRIAPLDDVDFPPAADWHPSFSSKHRVMDGDHALQYWLQAWPILHEAIGNEQRLEWMKIIIYSARDRLKANRYEVPFNISFHGLMGSLQVAAAFPALQEAAEWISIHRSRLTDDFSALPFITPDGYTREGSGYHNVNTRLLSMAYQVFCNAFGTAPEPLRRACENTFNVQAMLLAPDGAHWNLGDGMNHVNHEHWQDAHEALHLGAALFNRPDWKAQAGSVAGIEPELFTAYRMGSVGLDRWAAMGPIDLDHRVFTSAHAAASGFHVLRSGHGFDAHAGLLWFGSEHNHSHHDKGQALIYGLGRHLITDPGFAGYGRGDMDPMFSVQIHATASPIRRTPIGPRTDYTDLGLSLGHFESEKLQVALGRSLYFENHIIDRAVAMVTPHGPDGDVFWIIWDRITWKRGWPAGATEPFELINTRFPFNAPGCDAAVSTDGHGAWSRYDGPDGPPYAPGAHPRADYRKAYERHDSDANIQVIRLGQPSGEAIDGQLPRMWDLHIVDGVSSHPGDKAWPRPVAVYRWRGRLPHEAAYVLVPFRGLRDTPYASASGSADEGTVNCQVKLPQRVIEVTIGGLKNSQLSGAVRLIE